MKLEHDQNLGRIGFVHATDTVRTVHDCSFDSLDNSSMWIQQRVVVTLSPGRVLWLSGNDHQSLLVSSNDFYVRITQAEMLMVVEALLNPSSKAHAKTLAQGLKSTQFKVLYTRKLPPHGGIETVFHSVKALPSHTNHHKPQCSQFWIRHKLRMSSLIGGPLVTQKTLAAQLITSPQMRSTKLEICCVPRIS